MSYTSYDFPHTHFYDDDLRELIEMYTKIKNDVDELKSWSEKHEGEYYELLGRVVRLEGEIADFKAEIESEFDQLKNGLEQYIFEQVQEALGELIIDIGNLQSQIDSLRSDLTRGLLEVRSLIDAGDQVTMDWVEVRLEEFKKSIPDLTTINVFNPVQGRITSIQIAIDDLYNTSRTGALTAYEYDTMELEAGEYDALLISAYDYDNYAKDIFGRWGIYKNPLYYMNSPFTGEYVTIITVINELAYLHRSDALTAQEYDIKELTASDYDNYELTAFEYDWSGKTLLA